MIKKIYTLTFFISSTLLLTLFFAPLASAQENETKPIQPLFAGTIATFEKISPSNTPIQTDPVTAPVLAMNEVGSYHITTPAIQIEPTKPATVQVSTDKATQSANVNVLEKSTNIDISTDPAIDNATSLKIETTESTSNFINTNDTSIVESATKDNKSLNYTEGFTNTSNQIHNLEFITAPVYYSSDCACNREDSPPFPYDNSSPLHTQSALLNISGPTIVPVVGDIVAAVLFPTEPINVNFLVLALFGNIMMLLLRSYLRLRSGRSPAYRLPL